MKHCNEIANHQNTPNMQHLIFKIFTVLALGAMLMTTTAYAQSSDEAKNVLRRSREKCHSIQQGHYVMEHWMKYMDDNDTSMTRYTCNFKKVPEDTVYGKFFSMLIERDTDWFQYQLYTGKEFVGYGDTAGYIISSDPWAEEIYARRGSPTFYTVLTDQFTNLLPEEEYWGDSIRSFSLSETSLDGRPCHLVNMRSKNTSADTTYNIRCIRSETTIWIDKQDYLPVQYSDAFDIVQGQDTMYQYRLSKLLAFDTMLDESRLTIESIPTNVVLKDYVPYEAPEPLAEGTPAPDWALPTLAGDTVRLADLRGKVVLLDFFYKACGPCCAALPALQRLHEKYKDKGFIMIGIDPYDDPEKADMAGFLAKRDITYTVLFSDRELPETYRVSGYPTLFFLDRKGKIAKVQSGYHPTLEATIEEQLQKLLE